MPSSIYRTRLATLFLLSASLLSHTKAAAPPSADLNASLWTPKGAAVNNTHVLGIHDTSDGCPVGWVECSATTCYPLDGSTCCSDGNFCPVGSYCDSGGCCPNGKVCDGAAPPPSTIGGGPPATTPIASSSPTFSSSFGFPATSPSVSVGFSVPGQSTNVGSVTFGTTAAAATNTPIFATGATTTAGASVPTSGIGLSGANGAAAVLPLDAARGVGVWVAALVAAMMCIA